MKKTRDPATRRDRLPRRQQAETPKAPRSADFPIGTEDAQSYNLRDIPRAILDAFDRKCQHLEPPRSRRWTILSLMDRFARGKVSLEG